MNHPFLLNEFKLKNCRRTADIFEARQARLKEIRNSMNLFDEAEQTNEVEEGKQLHARLVQGSIEDEFINISTQFRIGKVSQKSLINSRYDRIMARIRNTKQRVFGVFG